jgi:hypothetical protein
VLTSELQHCDVPPRRDRAPCATKIQYQGPALYPPGTGSSTCASRMQGGKLQQETAWLFPPVVLSSTLSAHAQRLKWPVRVPLESSVKVPPLRRGRESAPHPP